MEGGRRVPEAVSDKNNIAYEVEIWQNRKTYRYSRPWTYGTKNDTLQYTVE